jgi:hypothetical protein
VTAIWESTFARQAIVVRFVWLALFLGVIESGNKTYGKICLFYQKLELCESSEKTSKIQKHCFTFNLTLQ